MRVVEDAIRRVTFIELHMFPNQFLQGLLEIVKENAGNPFVSCNLISSKFCKTFISELQVKLTFLLCSFSTTLGFSSFYKALDCFLEVF